ncbi:MAG TPA: hypothetical protein VE133_05260 [Candidatus Sulfotelmatobacter sp.]|nr:hypothetical protein [Candidatus Sulfotelmatobacter sp.]
MSTAVLERVIGQPETLELVAAAPAPQVLEAPKASRAAFSDPHPLLPVFVAGAISLVLTGTFIGAVLIWLATRHSGILAP